MTYEEFKEKVSDVILTESGNCPVMPVVQMLQGKWKLQILYELCIKSPMRFGELKKLLKPITNTALTNALKELEKDELVQRILQGWVYSVWFKTPSGSSKQTRCRSKSSAALSKAARKAGDAS